MKRTGLVLFGLTAAAFVTAPVVAWACPVCFSGSPRIREAFFNTTVFLSLLPLGMIGAGVVVLKRLGGGAWKNEFEDHDAAS